MLKIQFCRICHKVNLLSNPTPAVAFQLSLVMIWPVDSLKRLLSNTINYGEYLQKAQSFLRNLGPLVSLSPHLPWRRHGNYALFGIVAIKLNYVGRLIFVAFFRKAKPLKPKK